MSESLSEMQQEMVQEGMEEDIDALRDILENLIQLSFDQEDLIGQVNSVNINDPKYTDLIREQKNIKDDLKLVVMLYWQTDEEAGGTGPNRKVNAQAGLVGRNWWYRGTINNNGAGQSGIYESNDVEYPLKTIIVEGLKITEEAYNLGMKGNATQTFNFRANNMLFAVQGYVPIGDVTGVQKVRRNA